MSVGEWFIQYVLPLFIDTAQLSVDILADVRNIFAFTVTVCGVMLLIVMPYKAICWLLNGGKKK